MNSNFSEKLKSAAQEAGAIVNDLNLNQELKTIAFQEVFKELIQKSVFEEGKNPTNQKNDQKNNFFGRLGTFFKIPLELLQRIYDESKDDFNLILHPIPGRNKTDKEKNASILVLAGYSVGLGKETVPTGDLKAKLENIGLGTSNLSRNLRNLKPEVHVEGSAPHLFYKLTIPGLEKAKQLISRVNDEEEKAK